MTFSERFCKNFPQLTGSAAQESVSEQSIDDSIKTFLPVCLYLHFCIGNSSVSTFVCLCLGRRSDMEFVQNFTPPDFQAKNFTPPISPSFYSFSKKKHKKRSENREIYTVGKNFTLPPAVTASTNSPPAYAYVNLGGFRRF